MTGEDRSAKTQSLAALIPGLARRAVGKRGFTDARILNEWTRIVGETLANVTQPDRISYPKGRREGGTLHIRAEGPMALELQHLGPVVVERINAHFGFGAVSDIRILQAPPRSLSRRPGFVKTRQKPKPKLDPAKVTALQKDLSNIEDPELRDILETLGKSVLQRSLAQKRE